MARLTHAQRFVAAILVGLTIGSGCVRAEDQRASASRSSPNSEANLPDYLPDYSSGDVSHGLAIQSSNGPQFKALILPEFYALVRDGALQFSGARTVPFQWAYPSKPTDESKTRSRISVDDAVSASLAAASLGPIAGTTEGSKLDTDAREWGVRTLWNAESVWWSQRIIESHFELVSISNQKVDRKFAGEFIRVYRPGFGESAVTNQLFRESLRFSSPSVIAPLSFVTFRSLGDEEDSVWMYSPAVKQARQLTGSNRADSILHTLAGLDDFFLWSGKIENIAPTSGKTLRALIPFASLEEAELVQDNVDQQCFAVSEGSTPLIKEGEEVDYSEIDGTLNLATRVALPYGVTFVPREVWRLELNPRDPFAAHGRIVLYIDAQLMIPVAKVVYDRAGKINKYGLAILKLAHTPDDRIKTPVIDTIGLFEASGTSTALLRFSHTRFCTSLPSGRTLADFDPGKLGPAVESVETPKASSRNISQPQRDVR